MNAASHHRGTIDQADIRFLVEKNADGIIVVDEDGIVLFANPAAEQIFGRARDSLIGSPIGIPLISGETTEITILRPGGGAAEAEIRIVDTTWDQRPARLASLRDISARKALEERLREAARMEAVGRLTAGIAHDFNNLLTVVLGNLETAQRQFVEADATHRHALENATRGARRAAVLTERLLAFARRKPLNPHILDVNEIVAGMSDLLQRTLGERIDVQTTLDPAAWPIEADPSELEAAILNLAVNARDAMPAGGRLAIETSNVELDAAYAAANADAKPGPYLLIAVADAGSGMTADVLRRVFEPFFTTKPDGRGTGLGLSQVYGFVKQSGGHVKLYSEPSIGTTAKLYFPKAPAGSGDALPREPEIHRDAPIPRARAGETILVVEDDDDVRQYTAGSLRELGYQVFEAADSASALAVAEGEARIDLLFTDLGLPGAMDGKELADRIHAARPSARVLITTAYAGNVLIHEGRLAPDIELLPKPFAFAALAGRIRTLLDQPQAISGSRVLVVDDEALVRMLIVETLEQEGLQVEEAGNFAQGLAKARELGASLAAAIIDLGLPDRAGDALVAAVRELHPGLPVLLATGYASQDMRERFSDDPSLQIVGKPFDPQGLVAALQGLGVRWKRATDTKK